VDKLSALARVALKRTPVVSVLMDVLDALTDPEKRHALDELKDAHVLEELPRLRRLLNEKLEQLEESRLNVEELMIVVSQTVDMQRRTVRHEQRRRLTNVLVNGLDDPWNDVEHRLLLRWAFELDPEHILILDNWDKPYSAKRSPANETNVFVAQEIERALRRELVSRGVLHEELRSGASMHIAHQPGIHATLNMTDLGRRFLSSLRDPTPAET
jgi:hypothetical protein